jgi:hypothetical protein
MSNDILKTGRHFPGKICNGMSSAYNNAFTKPNVVEITNKSTTYNDCCCAVGQPAAWQYGKSLRTIEASAHPPQAQVCLGHRHREML